MDHRVDYSIFAQVYDRLMDKDMYPRWQHFVQKNVPGQHPGTLLDLGCGSGDFAVRMAQAGWTVTGLDLSPEMLTLAAAKAERAGVAVAWIQGDMQDLSGLGSFDVITSFDDSLCYLPRLAAVEKTIQAAAQHLVPGGRLFADVHSIHQTDDIFPGFMYNDVTEDSAFLWTTYAGDAPHSVEHELTFFIYDEAIDGYKRAMEIQKERTYRTADYRRAFTQAGFEDIALTADFGDAAVTPQTARWFFQGRRPLA